MGDVDETKQEPLRDGSDESITSSPEPDGEQPLEQAQVQKRKGGRKPIYATSEERKQRNRQAQAAFRERRTEYIKQLETTIKHHEDQLQALQKNHRAAADECLMLRYKNSLLERILLEKGIDVNAELRLKTGSPSIDPVRMPPVPAAPSQPVQRVAVSKGHQPRRYITHPSPKVDTTPLLGPLPESVIGTIPDPSPRSNPTPTTSHFSSPATVPTRSPNFYPQTGSAISPNLGPLGGHAQQRHTQAPLRPNLTPRQGPQRTPLTGPFASSSGVSINQTIASGHPTPAMKPTSFPSAFQSHLEQLEQEYESAADMVEDNPDTNSPHGSTSYPPPFPSHFPSQQQAPQAMNGQSHGVMNPNTGGMQPPPPPNPNPNYQPFQTAPMPNPEASNGTNYANMNTFFDPYDPMLDADPFGLSASMHFPTQFSYDTK